MKVTWPYMKSVKGASLNKIRARQYLQNPTINFDITSKLQAEARQQRTSARSCTMTPQLQLVKDR